MFSVYVINALHAFFSFVDITILNINEEIMKYSFHIHFTPIRYTFYMHKLNLAYLRMLNNMWDIEDQIIGALPKLVEHAHNAELKKGLTDHLEATKNHKQRLEDLFTFHTHPITYERDMAFQTLLQDALAEIHSIEDKNVKDTIVAASAQVVEHIEIARYRTLRTWAKELGDEKGEELIKNNLNDEEHASKTLFALSEGGLFTIGLNEKAAITGDI